MNVRVGLAATAAAVLIVLAAAGAGSARSLGPVKPKPNGVYPVGATVVGTCRLRVDGQGINSIISWFQYFDAQHGGRPAPGSRVGTKADPSSGCTAHLTSAGKWREVLVTDIATKGIFKAEILAVFTIGGDASPCTGSETEIASVTTPNGGTSGLESLEGGHLTPGKTLTAQADVRLTFGDGTVLQLTKGSRMTPAGCTAPKAELTWKEKLSLAVGKIWAQFASRREVDVQTDRTIVGVRGATFWITYDAASKRTTLHVVEGRATFQRRSGGPVLSVHGGRTAAQQGTAAPTLIG
ncbi:MAG: FecR domain-containing protein [Gaiellaceae bacterium]